MWENRTGELPLRQYIRDKVETFLKEYELDAEAAHTVVTGSVGAATASLFKTDEPLKSAKELRVLAEEAVAADVMERETDERAIS